MWQPLFNPAPPVLVRAGCPLDAHADAAVLGASDRIGDAADEICPCTPGEGWVPDAEAIKLGRAVRIASRRPIELVLRKRRARGGNTKGVTNRASIVSRRRL